MAPRLLCHSQYCNNVIRSASKPLQAHHTRGQGGAGDWRRQRHWLGDHTAARWVASACGPRPAVSGRRSKHSCRSSLPEAPRAPWPPQIAGLHGAKVVISGRREQVRRMGCSAARRRSCTVSIACRWELQQARAAGMAHVSEDWTGAPTPLQVLRDACTALAAEGVTAHYVQVGPA